MNYASAVSGEYKWLFVCLCCWLVAPSAGVYILQKYKQKLWFFCPDFFLNSFKEFLEWPKSEPDPLIINLIAFLSYNLFEIFKIQWYFLNILKSTIGFLEEYIPLSLRICLLFLFKVTQFKNSMKKAIGKLSLLCSWCCANSWPEICPLYSGGHVEDTKVLLWVLSSDTVR